MSNNSDKKCRAYISVLLVLANSFHKKPILFVSGVKNIKFGAKSSS
jgi:hypothetical protein